MKQVLVYGDSLSWGIIPSTRQRLIHSKRWPGAMEQNLIDSGESVRVIENCLNGRKTVWNDPFKAGRNGSEGLSQTIEIHCPLSLVIIALGTNDFQGTHDNQAWASAAGIARLIREIRTAPIEPSMTTPKIMLVVPPAIIEPKGAIAEKFQGAANRYIGFPEAINKLAETENTYFFDMNSVTSASVVDGIHLDENQHQLVADALTPIVLEILSKV